VYEKRGTPRELTNDAVILCQFHALFAEAFNPRQLARLPVMATIDIEKLGKHTLRVGEFIILPCGEVEGQNQVYVEQFDGGCRRFLKADIENILSGKDPAKALRAYRYWNF
jgi:hypothetical protein